MVLAFEKVMMPAVFVAKKAYSYMSYGPGADTPKHVSMGLLSKKRGTSMLIRDVFVACEQAYLLPPDSVSPDQVRQIQLLLLRNLMRALEAAAANLPEAFIKTTHLNHESMYKETQKLTHVCAARRLVKETGCAWPGGMRIKTIQAMPLARTGKATKAMKHSACASDHCFEFEHFRRTNLKVDVSYYIENVGNRFAALLRFSIPDIHDRFATAVNMVKSATAGSAVR